MTSCAWVPQELPSKRARIASPASAFDGLGEPRKDLNTLRAAALISSLSGEGPCPMLLEIQDPIIADQSLKANKRAEAPAGLDLTRFLPICPQEELSASQSLLSSAMGQPAIWLPADAFLLASNGQSSYLVHKVDEFYQQNRKYGELHPLIPLIQAWHRNRPRSGTPNTKDRSRILPETRGPNPSTQQMHIPPWFSL